MMISNGGIFFRWAKYFDKLYSINSRRVLYASPVSELAFKHTMKQIFNFHRGLDHVIFHWLMTLSI